MPLLHRQPMVPLGDVLQQRGVDVLPKRHLSHPLNVASVHRGSQEDQFLSIGQCHVDDLNHLTTRKGL